MRSVRSFAAVVLLLAVQACGLSPAMAQERTDIMPRVIVTSQEHLNFLMGLKPDAGDRIGAVYGEGVIYLSQGWTVRSLEDLSILLHEFVHHLQFIGALDYQCRQAAERPAYDAQIAFLEAHGETLEKPNEFTRMWLTTCPMEW